MPRKALPVKKGDVYGRLSIVKEIPFEGKGRRVICNCACGVKNKEYNLDKLKAGHTTSCGCYKQEILVKNGLKHGLYNTPLYKVHRGMKSRCYNPKAPHYEDYGGRGIKVCSEWRGKGGFENFYAWNESLPDNKKYKPGLVIDRRNNSKGYYPWNCRWITNQKNQNNKRSTRFVTFKNRKYAFSDFYNKYADERVSYRTALARVKSGWDPLIAVTAKVETYGK